MSFLLDTNTVRELTKDNLIRMSWPGSATTTRIASSAQLPSASSLRASNSCPKAKNLSYQLVVVVVVTHNPGDFFPVATLDPWLAC